MLSNPPKPVSIYFCQTCKDQLQQAVQALPQNLSVLESFAALKPVRGVEKADFKILVVDYGDPDEIYRHIVSQYQSHFSSGAISVFHVKDPPDWRMATVKNMEESWLQFQFS